MGHERPCPGQRDSEPGMVFWNFRMYYGVGGSVRPSHVENEIPQFHVDRYL